jgi:SAM-dependent methyltransferase
VIQDTQRQLDDYFAEKLETHGPTAQGVDYSSDDAQRIRFEQLIRVIDPSRPFSILDYGCGYGALLDVLNAHDWRFDYQGFDRIASMIETARTRHADAPHATFTTDPSELRDTDYVVAGAIFNIKLEASAEAWQALVLETLEAIDRHARRGFAFNMLTAYSDPDRMAQRPDLYYGDPLFFFDLCKRRFARNVALLHDYELYDFTILVRK